LRRTVKEIEQEENVTDEPQGNLIFAYTDAQALEDGVLVKVLGCMPFPINRVTRAVWDLCTRPVGSSALTGLVTDVTRISRLGDLVMEKIKRGEVQQGMVVLEHDGRTFWAMPNETQVFNHVQGWTVMFPEDY
jgi:hypothetical protein